MWSTGSPSAPLPPSGRIQTWETQPCPGLLRERLQILAQLDDVAVAVLPVLEKLEVRGNVLERAKRHDPDPVKR